MFLVIVAYGGMQHGQTLALMRALTEVQNRRTAVCEMTLPDVIATNIVKETSLLLCERQEPILCPLSSRFIVREETCPCSSWDCRFG